MKLAIAGIIAAALLTGCNLGSDKRYLDASHADSLELPPNLTEYRAESRFELPSAFSGDDPSARNRIPVLARVDSLQLEGSADFYWVSVQEPAANLYQQVKNFWASEGYRLEIDEPVIGVMQTEWVFREQGVKKEEQSFLKQLFASRDLSASQDQFKTRIERVPGGQQSRVYIAHRGTEYVPVVGLRSEKQPVDDTKWRFRQPEPALEIEMLARLMVYLGLQRSAVDEQVANAKLFAPRAFMHIDADENAPFMIVEQAYPIAWNRVLHELERLNFDIASAKHDTVLGRTSKGVIKVKTEVVEEQKKGFFSSLFSSKKPKARQFVLVVSKESHEASRIDLETAGRNPDSSPEGARFLELLYQQIK